MSKNPKAALIAARTFLYLERNTPGADTRTASRLYPDALEATAIQMAEALPDTAGVEERRAMLNELDNKGSPLLRMVDMASPDLTKMSAAQLLEFAHRKKHGKGGK